MASKPMTKKRFNKKLLAIYSVGLLALLLVCGITGAYLWYSNAINTPAAGGTAPLTLKVKAGETVMDIAPAIQKAGGLNSLDAFRIYLRINNVSVPLQVGTYEIPLNQTIPGLVAELQNGPKLLSVSVTIQEGLRADEINDILAVAFKDVPHPSFSNDEFMQIVTDPDSHTFPSEISQFLNTYKPQGKTLEGFLFPDTYNIGIDASAQDVVNLMVSNLITRLHANNINPDAGTQLARFYDVLTMASIVQREASGLTDDKMIADILIRRLNQGYGLNADATVLYPYKRWTPAPTAAELHTDTAYNTYIHFTLPPTPISNPGIDSINAVLNPTANTYYYYLHGKDGQVHYAHTLTEQTANARLYL